MIYFDTSYLVRLYYADAGAEVVRALAATDHVACAAHGQAEMIAAFHRKLREGAIGPAAYAALLRQVRAHHEAGAFRWLAADQETFSRIAEVYAKLPAAVYLRAADAIHLATAVDWGFRVVYSHDVHLLAAAEHFGIEGRNVIGLGA
ncbi:MAG TPA: type II toxin-antitoxin system VapC family toxin [Candidatus Cybelea sp.]|nr:type II toxin-antitoxin system VapC family toxin [Candidatus Cybelea sp.]